MFNCPPLGSVVASLPTEHEVPGMALGSVICFLSSGEVFHGMYGLDVYEFQCYLSMFCPVLCWEEAPALC